MTIDPTSLLVDLPNDKEAALCELAHRADELHKQESLNGVEYGTLAKLLEQFAAKNDLDIEINPKESHGSWRDHFLYVMHRMNAFENDVKVKRAEKEMSDLIDDYKNANSKTSPFGYAFLSTDEKEEIRTKLNEIRNVVDASSLSARKKNALFIRISRLAEEVDRDGTKTDSFFSFAIDLAMTAGEMAGKAKPAVDQFKDILKIILKRRAEAEGVALPKPDDYPKLPSPEI
jgi:hypothetical protein